jgi:hypothetical protein
LNGSWVKTCKEAVVNRCLLSIIGKHLVADGRYHCVARR